MSAAPKGSKFVGARITTITYVLWEIWKAKCLATYGAVPMNARAVPMNARAVALCMIFEVQCVPLLTKGTKPSSCIHQNHIGYYGSSGYYC